jgi:hypothetical protein
MEAEAEYGPVTKKADCIVAPKSYEREIITWTAAVLYGGGSVLAGLAATVAGFAAGMRV